MLANKNLASKPLRLVLLACLAYGFLWIKGWPLEYDDEELPASQRHQTTATHHVGTHELVVSVVTTATDVYDKLAPTLLLLDEHDAGQVLLFGDLQMAIGPWPVFDAVARLPHKLVQTEKQLAGYRRQLALAGNRRPLAQLREPDAVREQARLATLAKFKMLPAMADAWLYRPNRTWYAFVDDDAFVDRPNLLAWLSQHDANTTRFFANPPARDVPAPLAAGGSAFILSGRAMKELLAQPTDLVQRWAPHLAEHPNAFDLVASVVRKELHVEAEGVWPGMSGFEPATVPLGPYALWCDPVMMLHKLSVPTASRLWRLQQDRAEDNNATGPLAFAHLWDRFLVPENLNDTRDDWDNLSSDSTNARWNILFQANSLDENRARSGEASWEACAASCEANEYCVQWSYSSVPSTNWNENKETQCHLSSSIRHGVYTPPHDVLHGGGKRVKSWKSGWRKAKFESWAKGQQCREKP